MPVLLLGALPAQIPVVRSTTHYPQDYGLWLRLAATGCIQLRIAEHRAKFARAQQLRPRCTAQPSAFPKLNVAGSNPVARSNTTRALGAG